MFRTGRSTFAIAITLGASLVFSQVATAGGYPSNACVGKKMGATGKYTKSVGKAWAKNPIDTVARDAAIAAAFTKLGNTWTKEETKSAGKNADCSAATDTAANAAALVDAAIEDLATAMPIEDFEAAAGYVAGAMKARGKYIKDATKDLGRVKLEEGRAKASTKYLTGASVPVSTAALQLESDLNTMTTITTALGSSFTSVVPGATVIYGKDELTPSCVDGDPYLFWARKGTSNNVLMYYQGGGACWNTTSCDTVGTCKRTVSLGENPDLTGTGFADYDNPSNPFTDWSVVVVSYCTCDVHWGSAYKFYQTGVDANHYGRINAAVAEKYAREHFVDPDKVFVTGSSAGSYGAIMNSYWLMKEVWPNADYAVLGDAGVGVTTQHFLDNYIDVWGLTANFPTDLPGVELPVQNLSLVDLVDGLATAYPNARFANYDASYDGGSGSQCQFFQVMNNPVPQSPFPVEWPKWWAAACDWNACMRDFKEENSERATNYKFFTGAGTRHTMFGSDKVYTEIKSTRADNSVGMTIAEWVQAMVDDTADWVNVDCNNPNGDCELTDSCQGGTNAGGLCSSNVDCTVGATCTGGTAPPATPCTTNADCPGSGGFCPYCQEDPDTAEAPFNNDNSVTCLASDCPCGPSEARCGGGPDVGDACVNNSDCTDASCQHVRCPTFTP